ncbi:hypothetical protein OG900_10570 [Streptomyces sp. NBC_00433]
MTNEPPRPADGPPGAPPQTTPWASDTLRERKGPVTGRLRRTVADLPAWDPLPPGEPLVRRPGSAE